MKRILSLIIMALPIFFFIHAGKALAISLSVHPNPATAGQPVTADISARFLIPPPIGSNSTPGVNCEIMIDYGDGNRQRAGICRSLNCNLSVTHRYATPGRYLVVAFIGQSCNTRSAGSYIDRQILVVNCRPLLFTSPSMLPAASVGKPYSYRLSTNGGEPRVSYSFAGGRLPTGLSLTRDGLLRGRPGTSGIYSFTVMAADSCPQGSQRVQKNFTIEVKAPSPPPPTPQPPPPAVTCPALSITTGQALETGEVNRPYSARITYSGGVPPVRLSLSGGRLPRGISFSGEGVLSGIPREAGRFVFSVSATDSCEKGPQVATRQFTLNVKKPPVKPRKRNLSVSVSPARVTVPRGLPSTLNLTYTFSGDSSIDTVLDSPKGAFQAKGHATGTNSMPLRVHVQKGRATVREQVNIPVAVLKRAERLGTTRFSYARSFNNGEFHLQGQVEIIITTEAASSFRISRIQLYFENKRAETTIARGQHPPRLFAEIRYLGTGLFKGYWEVDGRPLADVFRHITYGRSMVLELPVTAVLPTFEPGVHRVRFVITNPEFDEPLPEAIYYVTTESYKVKRIRLVGPAQGQKVSMNDLIFKWKGLDNSTFAYLVEFRDKEDGKPLFSAYVKSTSYAVPPRIAVRYFASAGTIYWQVKGFDQDGGLIGESPLWKFTLKEKASYVPGQVMLVWRRDQKNAVKELEKRLGIRLLYRFDLTVLKRSCGVFSTRGQSVPRVIKRASRLPFVRYAGPNYIFQLLSDPLVKRQSIFDILDLSRIESLRINKKVKVAVIDTGVDFMHPDLKDGVIERENYIFDEDYRPEIHGTAVAGIIGARRNNIGIEGIAPRALVLALRACRQMKKERPEGQCFSDAIARAINHAIEKGAKVVNMSLGAYADDGTIKDLIQEGQKRGVLFVAPVGNRKDAERLPFPARLKEVLAVGGVDDKGKMFPNSRLCKRADLLAPCENIFTTISAGRYNFLSGTSMASAIVAGLLTLDIDPPSKAAKKPLTMCDWLRHALNKRVCRPKKE